ncbi:DNA gyrase inhibitor YacG [Parvularcula sp. LCG005]|uniref:DNA gyrase inhibitor YacG n=1 Tax=Parvularcula sp. LCG005 TaxID=3078805 RepID=UPI002942F401|nr:DNA gyrase inhibitor YacG [Parvularcula sp. LCG005]WOI53790.1 DNA gyrase inhibitor YacG [Parvularcula sp. LCG005]
MSTDGPRCSLCGQPVAKEYKPFCSKRCADVDLNRWLSGTYVITAHDEEDDSLIPDATPPEDA